MTLGTGLSGPLGVLVGTVSTSWRDATSNVSLGPWLKVTTTASPGMRSESTAAAPPLVRADLVVTVA